MRVKEKLYVAKKCQQCIYINNKCKVMSSCENATVTMCKKYKRKKKESNIKNKSEEDAK